MANTYISIGEDILNTERGSSYSIDSGLTWININGNPDTYYVQGNQIAMLDQDHGFAGGFSTSATVDGVFKWGGGSMLRAAHLGVSAFSNDKSVTVSPNPTSGLLNISGKNLSQVVVYDILGKQISATNYSSLNNVCVDLGSLSNGVYMVKVANDLGTSTIKVLKN